MSHMELDGDGDTTFNGDGDTTFDDDFPEIEDDELAQLEQNAISSTQHERGPVEAGRNQAVNQPYAISRIQQVNPPAQHRHVAVGSIRPRPPQSYAHPQQTTTDSFDSTLDEHGLPIIAEERANGNVQRFRDETTEREQWRRNRFGQPSAPTRHQVPPLLSKPQPQVRHVPVHSPTGRGPSGPVPALSRQVTESIVSAVHEEETLRNKLEELTASLAKANEEILARKGEIKIIRAKQAEGEKLHQRELGALRRVKQEEMDRHKAAIEALHEEQTKTASSIQFLQKELSDESRKVQSLQKQLKDKPSKEKPSYAATPPRKNVNSLRDGFDEDIMMISPSKSGRRSNRGTPTANRKRKQPPGADLIVQPLVLRPSTSVPENDDRSVTAVSAAPKDENNAPVFQRDERTQQHLQLIQQVLGFRPFGAQEMLPERLIRFSFPSDASKPFSTIVLTKTAKLKGNRLPGDLLQIFIDLWTRALWEKYYVCVDLLIEIVNFILEVDLFIADAQVITSLLPIIQSTAETKARARFHTITKKDGLDNPAKKLAEVDKVIDCTACLDLLFTIACLIVDDTKLIHLFWRSMTTDFVLMMLNACQPVSDVTLMLQILSTSILPATFGNVCSTEEQIRMESYIIDRICYLLWETPKILEQEKPYPRSTVCNLRLEALELLARLTMTSSPNPFDPSLAMSHGTVFIANHPTAIARLVRSIYDETAAMYMMTPCQPLHASLVNHAVRILHFVLNSPTGKQIDLQRKLAGTNGGARRHRVVLTRLAFSEGLYIDRGITEETVRMATDLLEDTVTPDEADDLTAAFGGITGRSGSTQQR